MGDPNSAPQSFNGDVTNKNVDFYSKKEGFDSGTLKEAAQLSTLKNQLAEVAVTFDQPYTYEQIQQMIPKNLLINWYWLGYADIKDEQRNEQYVGVSATNDYYSGESLDPSDSKLTGRNSLGYTTYSNYQVTDAMYEDFVAAVKKAADLQGNRPMTYPGLTKEEQSGLFDPVMDAVKQIKKYPTLDQAKFSGVILTGRTQNFEALNNKTWVYATSVGATTPIVPYVTPIK